MSVLECSNIYAYILHLCNALEAERTLINFAWMWRWTGGSSLVREYSPKQGSGGRTGGLHPLILVYRKRPLSVCCSRSTFAVRWRHGLWSGSTLKVLTVSDGEDRCLEVQGLDYGSLAEGSLA